LDAAEPAWHVMYRPSTGEVMAVAMWDPGFALVLIDPDPDVLIARMRAAERRPGLARTGLSALDALDALDALSVPDLLPRGGAEPPEGAYRRGPPPGSTGRHRHGQFRPG
jgi:hypothetical protein